MLTPFWRTCSIDFYIRNHLSALEHTAAHILNKDQSTIFIIIWLMPRRSDVSAGLKCLGGNEVCLIRSSWRWAGGYYITEFICLAWLLTALTCIAYISHVSHLHSWSAEPWSRWLPSTARVSSVWKVLLISHVGSVPHPHQVNLGLGSTVWRPLYFQRSARTMTSLV